MPVSAARAYDVVMDFARYPQWWPARFKPRAQPGLGRLGQTVEFSPSPFVRVGWEVVAVDPGRWVDVRYHKGPHTGLGRWEFEPDGMGGCRVRFSVEIRPKSRTLGLVYKAANVPRVHSRDIQRILRRLERRLGVPAGGLPGSA